MESLEELLRQFEQRASLSDDERRKMFKQLCDWEVRQPLINGSPTDSDLEHYARHVIMQALEAEGLQWSFSAGCEFALRWPQYGKELYVELAVCDPFAADGPKDS
jgi:hypothetical protein